VIDFGQLAAGIAHEINTPTQVVTDDLSFLEDACTSVDRLLEQYRSVVHGDAGSDLSPLLRDQLREADKTSDLEFLFQEMPLPLNKRWRELPGSPGLFER
jgi:two-component system, NtrC family, sensor kinase